VKYLTLCYQTSTRKLLVIMMFCMRVVGWPCGVCSSSIPRYDNLYGAMLCLRWSLTALSSWRPGFSDRPVHVRFQVDKVALGQVSAST